MPGDFVIAIGSTPIEDAAQCTQVILSADPGMKTTITLLRFGKPMTLSMTFGGTDVRDAPRQDLWPGFTVTEVTGKAEASGNLGGVAVATITREKSPAAAGLKLADLIKTVNGIKVKTLVEFYRALNANGGRSASVVISREGKEIALEL
jgi:serine protease Do/serine protease DegQ